MPTTPQLSNAYWYSFLFVVGCTSIAVEMAGLRFLAPLFGSSLPVWGLAIAVVLAGLAWGYNKGGRLALPGNDPSIVFSLAAWGSTLFLWMPAVFAIAMWSRDQSHAIDANFYLLPAALLAYGILFACSFIFGKVSPLAIQVESDRRQQSAGQVAGRLSSLTTAGSLAGILIPSFITIPLLGSHITVWLFAGLALALSAGPLVKNHGQLTRILALSALAVLVTFGLRSRNEHIIFSDETKHQYVTVRQENDHLALIFDANLGTQSVLTPNLYTDGYWDYMASLPALLPDTINDISVLVLGAAASTTERQIERFWGNEKSFTFTSVELDGDLFNIADNYFDPPARTTITADARLFATRSPDTYDLITVDTYARELTIPFHLTTTQFFAELAKRVSDHGVVAVNVNSATTDTLWLRSIGRTLRHNFPYVQMLPVPRSCNYLLLASRSSLSIKNLDVPPAVSPFLPALNNTVPSPTDGMLLTDDRSPTDLLGLAALLTPTNNGNCGAEQN